MSRSNLLPRQANTAGTVLLVFVLAGCAGRPFEPTPVQATDLKSRTITQTQGPVRVSAAVPSAEETQTIFRLPLYDRGIQPVWLEIANQGAGPVRLAIVSLDPEYYSPLEVAYKHKGSFSKAGRAAMQTWFHDNGMKRMIPPGETRSGFVFTHLDPGTKAFNVDVYSNDEDHQFTFFVPVPGFTADHAEVDFDELYAPDEVESLTQDGLRQALMTLPCCSTDETGEETGDPFNVVAVGEGRIVGRALIRDGWRETAAGSETTAVARMHRYRGRRPDATFHKARPDGSERMELRFWLSPMRVDDRPVWLGQVSHDMRRTEGDGATAERRLDPDLDAARMYLLQGVWYSQALAQVGLTTGGTPVPIDAPRTGLAGGQYFTDGLRVVLWISERPVGLDETVVLRWERLEGSK